MDAQIFRPDLKYTPCEVVVHCPAETLYLSLDAILLVAFDQGVPRSLRTFEKKIEVQITPLQQVQAFVAGNCQFLLGTILIPVGMLGMEAWSNRPGDGVWNRAF